MEYIEPKQGTNIWVDAMVITKACDDLELAHAFMEFMLDYENAYANSSYVGYTSPVMKVENELAQTEYEGIGAYMPDFEGPKNEVFRYQDPEIKALFADLWTKVKAY
jgi:spermidine/putrescine transport system permease protein